ncbi:hypothetical protein [Encephalitozoon cuniculi GB-M1]|uniref:Uncharacterized protein n=1 Tax=Encephalitozoon cuniculi (strain GB-M1) TaxID=284813 RepID=Q8SUR0_ENCCU|nr:uncharacterized protein ECU08_0780 [Encephalitozoon cuniculi GB-M1]CAD26384.1 hypothetical protein [Encephalitozoon cuniculi GB-M1]
MGWDLDREGDGNEPLEEVKRVKKTIESMDVKPVGHGKVSLSGEENVVGGNDLNFIRQVKKRVNDYKHKTLYNIGRTRNPYVFTRNSVVMMIEEELGVEILVRGSYKPEELNGDTDDSDALVYEISAPTPEVLKEAMSRIPSITKVAPTFPWSPSCSVGRHVWKNGVKYHSYRIPVDPKEAEKGMDGIRRDIELAAAGKSVEIVLRGRFSGHVEPCLGEESNEPMYIQVIGRSKKEVRKACREIIDKRRANT